MSRYNTTTSSSRRPALSSRNTPTSPIMTLQPLLHLSQQKLSHLSSLIQSSPRDHPHILLRGVVIQNAVDWGVEELENVRRREIERIRNVGWGSWTGGRQAGRKVEMMVVSEEDEEEEEEQERVERVQIAPAIIKEDEEEEQQVNAIVVDPSTYLQTDIIEGQAEDEWFEETWRELTGDERAPTANEETSPGSSYSAPSSNSSGSFGVSTPSASPGETIIEVCAVEDEEGEDEGAMFDYGSSGSYALFPVAYKSNDLTGPPPPPPSLRPTIIYDKLYAPMVEGTQPPSLACAVEEGSVWEEYEIESSHLSIEEPQPMSTSFEDEEEDVPELEYDSEDDRSQHRVHSTSSTYTSPIPIMSPDEEFLTTPESETLGDDFSFGRSPGSSSLAGSFEDMDGDMDADEFGFGWRNLNVKESQGQARERGMRLIR